MRALHNDVLIKKTLCVKVCVKISEQYLMMTGRPFILSQKAYNWLSLDTGC